MAYEVNKTDGTILLNIQEGEIDTTYGLNLLGKNYLGYGELIAENFVKLLENFNSNDEPANPIVGQIWYRNTDVVGEPKQINIYQGGGVWKPVGHLFFGTQPSLVKLAKGDMWFDTANQGVFMWDGTAFIQLNNVFGVPGLETGVVINETIKDTNYVDATPNLNIHPAIKLKVNGILVAILSSDADYVPHASENLQSFCGADAGGVDANLGSGDYNQTGIIGKGLNLNSSSDFKIRGVAVEAEFADVAEIYVGDATYEPGTLVALGGVNEVTSTMFDGDPSIFGVVSTRPAYLLNARKKREKHAMPIAVAGRIPTKVSGPIGKGDRLVASETPGVARKATENDPLFSIIGRSLQDYDGEGIGLIEATVGVR